MNYEIFTKRCKILKIIELLDISNRWQILKLIIMKVRII